MKYFQRLPVRRDNRHASFALILVAVFLVAGFRLPVRAQAAGKQVLHGHVPAVVARLQPAGTLSGATNLQLAIGLPLRNAGALTNLLRQIYDPASPHYHHYLTPAQFAEQFGPTEKDYRAVIAFAGASGLKVTATHPNRVLLDVGGPVAAVEKALHVTLRVYQHPKEKRTFYAPDREPSLDLSVPVLQISGLDNYALPQPHLQATPLNRTPKDVVPSAGSGPGGNYLGGDFRAAYVPDTTLTGSGQAVGLLQFDGYTAGDITYYESLAGLPNVTLQNVLIDGASGNPSHSGGEVEVSLDIEMAISMAPGLSKVIVYMAPNPSPWVDLLNRMATDNLAKQLSCSWYQPGGASNALADQIFQQMAAQGQSFFNASGDYDAYTGLISFPGDTPYLTQVGGTTLTTTGPGGAMVSETVWNRNNGIGSGGGISTQYPIPSWQTNINLTPSQGSATLRNIPDVALTAENVYVRANGINYNVGGTSCAAPLWAGFAALVNQQAAASGHAPVGFVTPAIYALGGSPNYTACFHDITTGDNTSSGSPTRFYAVSGYDLCTGWGTPAGQNLINALANPEALLIAPAAGFAAVGGAGGPFTVTTQSFTLTNAGTNSLTWTLANPSAWLTASPVGGPLTPGGSAATVTVSLNAAASNLVVGTYSATLWFTNLNDQVGQSRPFSLSVISPPAVTTQPADQAVLEGATAAFTVAATGGLPLSYQWQDNGTNLTDGGNLSGSTTTNLVINHVSAANVGTYTVVVTNLAGTTVSSNALLTLTPSAPVIIVQPNNQEAVVGTSPQFSVTAIGTTPLYYQWQFSGTNLVGATNAVLTLTNVQLANAGAYAVTITNLLGSTTSSNASLAVYTVPVITTLSPWAGVAGVVVNIAGLNFDAVPGNNAVYFGAVRAVVTAASATNLVVTVPAGATFGPVTETVNGLTAYAPQPFLPTFAGDGSGISAASFGSRQDLTAGTRPSQMVIADLDGDGKPDLIVTEGGSNGEVSIYRNISTNGSLTAGSFAPQVVVPLLAGLTCYCIAVADVDGDGRLDIVVVNNGNTNVVSILRNISSPGSLTTNSFAPRVDFPGSNMSGLAVRDLNGDGKPEIVTANWSDNTISVFQNLSTVGNIAFAPRVNFATGSNPNSVVIGDLDGDGKPDLVTVNYTGATVSVFRNLGAGGNITINSFAPKVDFAVPATPIPIAIGDLDGDGRLDLVVGCESGSHTLSVFRNTATAGSFTTNSFAPRVDFAAAGWVNCVALADLDGDGKLDVVLVSQSSSLCSVFKNVSVPGSFTTASLAARVDYSAGYNPNGILVGDLDGDGRPDLVFANTYDNTLSIYRNLVPFGAAPTITAQPTNQAVAVGGTATFSVTAGGTSPLSCQWNFNGTNILGATNTTLALANVQFTNAGTYAVLVTNNYGSILSSNAVLTVNPAPPIPVITTLRPWAGVAGVVVNIVGLNFDPVAGNNAVYFGAVRAVVTAASATNLVVTVPAGATFGPVTETVNGLTAYAPQPFLPTFAGDGSGISAASFGSRQDLTSGTGPFQVVIADLDGDGKPDLITTDGGSSGELSIYRNLSTNGSLTAGSFAPRVVLPLPTGTTYAYWIAAADVDGDGRLDLIAGSYGSTNVVSIYRNISSPGSLTTNSFAARVDLPTENSGVAVQDLNGDGKPEIVTANYSANTISVFQNLSTGGNVAFAPPVKFATGGNPTVVAIGDLDGDGKPDLAVANYNGATVSVFRNLGAGGNITTNSFASKVDFAVPTTPFPIVIGDLDGDGRLDLVVGCESGSHTISVFRNTATAGSFTTNSFAPRVDFAAAGWVNNLALADLDGDGKLDVVLVSQLSSLCSVFRNVSVPGSFTTASLAARVDYSAGSNPNGISVGDLDGDGRPDLVFANNNGNTLSIYRNLVPFGAAPTITAQPVNQAVAVGGTATFSVTAVGTSPLSCQWNFNGTNLVGATNTALSIGNVQFTNGGTYAVLVTNTFGSVLSSNAVLTLLTPPAITNQPMGQRVSVGCNAAFSVGAGGTAPLRYQWWSRNSTLGGQTNATLQLTNVQATDFTNYFVIVTNSYGSVTSSNAVLAQNQPPVAVQDILQRLANGDVKVQVSTLLANDTDADGDALAFLGVSTNSAAGGAVSRIGNWVYYQPPAGYTNADAFTYTISDGYCGGTATGSVLVQVMTVSGPSHNFTIHVQPDGSVLLVFAGIPGWSYRVQYADTLPPVNWTDLSTNTADALGVYQYLDVPPANAPTRFYRSVSP